MKTAASPPFPPASAEAGFSLMSVLVGLAILGISAQLIASTHRNNMRETKIIEDRQALDELRRYIRIGIGCAETVQLAATQCSAGSGFVELRRRATNEPRPLIARHVKASGSSTMETPTKVGKYWLRAKCTSSPTTFDVEFASGAAPSTWNALFDIPLKCPSA